MGDILYMYPFMIGVSIPLLHIISSPTLFIIGIHTLNNNNIYDISSIPYHYIVYGNDGVLQCENREIQRKERRYNGKR